MKIIPLHDTDFYALMNNTLSLKELLIAETSDIEVFVTVFPQPDYIEANPKQRSEKVLPNKKCLCADYPVIIGLAEYLIISMADVKTVTSWNCKSVS